MANGMQEPEEEFNDQFVLDDDSLDDLNLDDDALFADLDNEIRLDSDGGANEGGEGGGGTEIAAPDGGSEDFDLDLDGEDMGKIEIGLDDGAEADSSDAAAEIPDAGLDDLLGDTAPAAGSGDGLDDLMGGDAGDDGLDDLMGDTTAGGGADTGLDDLMGDVGGTLDGGLDDPMDDSAAAAPEETDAANGEMDLNLMEEELSQDENGETSEVAEAEEPEADPGAGDAGLAEGVSVEDDLGDLNLDLGAEEISLDVGDPADEVAMEEAATKVDAEEIAPEELGDEEFELPPLDDDTVAAAAAEEIPVGEDLFADADADTLEAPPETDLSMTVSVEDESRDLDDAPTDIPDFEGEPFIAAPDIAESDLELQLDALDGEPGVEEITVDDGEADSFSVSDIPSYDAEEIGEVSAPGTEEEQPFSAVADIDLEEEHILELGAGAIDGGEGGLPSIPATASEDMLQVPVEPEPARAEIAATPPPAPAAAEVTGITTDVLLSVSHQISVELGSISLRGQDILDLSYGSVVPLERSVGDPVDLVLGGRAIAQGEIVLINGKSLGVRIVAVNR